MRKLIMRKLSITKLSITKLSITKLSITKLSVILLLIALLLPACGKQPDSAVNDTSPDTSNHPAESNLLTETDTAQEATLSQEAAGAQEPPFVFTEENFPRMDGSTANIPLGQALAAAVLGKPYDECSEYVNFNKTSQAYFDFMEGKSDILIIYEPSSEVLSAKTQYGIKWEMAPIGRDGLVFLVNQKNPVSNLSTQNIRDIYDGEITNWQEVGGNDAAILPYQRQINAGSQTLFQKFISETPKMKETSLIIGSMGGLVEAVASFENGEGALGYNVFYYVTMMKEDPNIKILSVDSVEPTNDTIQSGEYPYVNDFYAVIREDEPEDSPARILFNFLQSDTGKELIRSAGYVPVP